MRTSDHINKYRQRILGSPYDSKDEMGMWGCFAIPLDVSRKVIAECVVAAGNLPECKVEGTDWEHVSVKIAYMDSHNHWRKRIPRWEEMCAIKDLFWKEDEQVIQVHPAKADYVNHNPFVLHLWRPVDGVMRLPPKICV